MGIAGVGTAAVLLLATGCGAPASGARAESPRPEAPLRADATPLGYALELSVTPESASFSGEVLIDVALHARISVVPLHARGLHVSGVAAWDPRGRRRGASWEATEEGDIGHFVFRSPVGPGRVRLRLRFSGDFALAGEDGLFATRRMDGYYAATQFEPTGARRAFPCFDEPKFRTPFRLTLDIPRGYVAASNTPIAQRTDLADRLRIRFEETAALPTYLVGWVVGPFHVLQAGDIPPSPHRATALPVRVLAPPTDEARGRRILEEARRALPVVERLLGVPFPFSKLELALVPDLPVSGMENAALVTIAISPGFFDEAWEREVVIHEIAHQWLGDLVSLSSWDEQWVKEAFTEWATARSRRGVDVPRGQVQDTTARVLAIRGHSHRVLSAPAQRYDFRTMLDGPTSLHRARATALLFAFERWVGVDAMAAGVKAVLTEHAWGAASLDEYLEAIGESAEQPDFADAFRTFMDQPGMPVVEAALSCDEARPTLRLTQRPTNAAAATRWLIPVCARYLSDAESHESCTLLRDERGSLALETDQCPVWVMPNAGGVGFFRIGIDSEAARALLEHGWPHLKIAERFALFGDLRLRARSGGVTVAEVVREMLFFATAQDRGSEYIAPAALAMISEIRNDVLTAEQREILDAVVSNELISRYDESIWTEETRRSEIVSFLALEARNPRVRADASRHALPILDGEQVPGPRRPLSETPGDVALAVAIQEASPEEVEGWLERGVFSSALARADDPDVRGRAWSMILSSEGPYGELGELISRGLRMAETRRDSWQWLLLHLPQLAAIPSRPRTLHPLDALGAACGEQMATQLERAASGLPSNPLIDAALPRIRECGTWADALRPSAGTLVVDLPPLRTSTEHPPPREP